MTAVAAAVVAVMYEYEHEAWYWVALVATFQSSRDSIAKQLSSWGIKLLTHKHSLSFIIHPFDLHPAHINDAIYSPSPHA